MTQSSLSESANARTSNSGSVQGRIRTVKVAVVGSGLAGLTASYLLASANGNNEDVHFDVHLFEKADSIGMDAHSVTVPLDGQDIRINVPMRSFQGGYYPNLLALYDHLGVEYREANFSYSFSHLEFDRIRTDRMALRPHLIYNGRSGRNGVGIPGRWLSDRDDYAHESSPKSQPSLRNNVRILTDPVTRVLSSLLAMLLIFCFFIRLNLLCIPMIWRHDSPETLREWTSRTTPTSAMARWTRLDDRWRAFVRDVVLPLFSAVCTAPEEDVYEHPINEILEYILLTLFTSHYVVKLGVADAVRRIMKPIPSSNIHLSATIVSIEVDPLDPSSSRIFFSASSPTNHGGTSNSDSESQKHTSISGFDHVVLATQANNAIPLLTTLRSSVRTPKSAFQRSIDAQIDCLKRFKYIPTIVVNHTDEAFLPEREADRRDLNLVVWHERRDTSTRNYDPNVPCLPAGYAMATHDVRYRASSKSISSSPSKRNYILQTTNPIHPPSPSSIISVARIERGVLTSDSKLAQKDLMSVENGRWVVKWTGFSSASWGWVPFIVNYCRTRKLGKLQGAGKLETLERAPLAAKTSVFSSDCDHDIVTNGLRSPAVVEATTGPGVWLCGSYAHPGIPLLEACVNSALNVVENGIFVVEGVASPAEWAIR